MNNFYRIGIDFDNTIICYDKVFNLAGWEKGLIPKELPYGKNVVRDYLRKINKEEEWIKLQGYVYGTKLFEAYTFEGIKEFLLYCKEVSIDYCIVSHKTLNPYRGYPYDLHKAAYQWLERGNFNCDIFFELTKEEKIQRILKQKCTHFIDDLPEFLMLPGFSEKMVKILFDPLKQYSANKIDKSLKIVQSWREICTMLQKDML